MILFGKVLIANSRRSAWIRGASFQVGFTVILGDSLWQLEEARDSYVRSLVIAERLASVDPDNSPRRKISACSTI